MEIKLATMAFFSMDKFSSIKPVWQDKVFPWENFQLKISIKPSNKTDGFLKELKYSKVGQILE
jgi:hypothetical protein